MRLCSRRGTLPRLRTLCLQGEYNEKGKVVPPVLLDTHYLSLSSLNRKGAFGTFQWDERGSLWWALREESFILVRLRSRSHLLEMSRKRDRRRNTSPEPIIRRSGPAPATLVPMIWVERESPPWPHLLYLPPPLPVSISLSLLAFYRFLIMHRFIERRERENRLQKEEDREIRSMRRRFYVVNHTIMRGTCG